MTELSDLGDIDFAKSDDEAKSRFEKYKTLDPFPTIQPALLNSADVADYVRLTGMIWPFYPDDRKSASYEIALLGKSVVWDDDGVKHVTEITQGSEFVLRANSIAFVTVEPMFRLPDYMAFRFNLRISHVYKGILLGTGPLVDPGFQGKLSIPLHNLTANDYTFKGGDGIIWMEFTKLSPNDHWHKDSVTNDRIGNYKGFPPEKNELKDVEDYLEKAVGRERRIRTSIPDVIQTAQKSAIEAAAFAKAAKDEVTTVTDKIRTAGIISAIVAVIALLIPLYYGFIQVYSLVTNANSYVTQARKEMDLLNRRIDERNLSDTELDLRLAQLASQLRQLSVQTRDAKLRSDLEQIRSELEESRSKLSGGRK